MFFTPRYLKEARMLRKGIKKFINYKRDVLPEEKLREIETEFEAYNEAVKSKDRERIETEGRKITRICEGALPAPSNPALRENVEVFFVAVIIALGIRTYFAQPFRIPTGSMRPTLNGIIGYSEAEAKAKNVDLDPGFLTKTVDFVLRGRRYVDVKAPFDFKVTGVTQKNKFFFFTRTVISTNDGRTISIPAPVSEAYSNLGLKDSLGVRGVDRRGVQLSSGKTIRKGEQIARGYVETGDQVIVNRVSYHFRKPGRGEVFVFTTRDMPKIQLPTPAMGSQHYIKRLAGVPGDMLDVRDDGYLYIRQDPDGKWARASEPGFLRVAENPDPEFRGYSNGRNDTRMTFPDEAPLGKEYFAMGDNSRHSSDSRLVDPVPEKNLVGPALLVYYPFDKHFGLIR